MRRSLVVLLSAFAVLALPSTPAHAGGPTSVLVTNPNSGEATALYYTSDEYVALERLIQTSEPVEAPPEAALTGTDYNVTWLLHDIMVWRTDFVYIDAKGGPFVQTRALNNDGSFSERSTWSRVTDGKALASLLDQTLGGRPATSPSLLDESARQAPAPEAAAAPAPAPEPEVRWFSLAGWRWAVVGLLGGLLAGVFLVRRRPEPEGSRQILEDRVTQSL